MPLIIWRDSVAMGDDTDAPHEWHASLEPTATIGDVVSAILDAHYLASIIGGRATWIVDGTEPLAVMAQQWSAPQWLVAPDTPVAAFLRPDGSPQINVRYWCQADPDLVYECLRKGLPLPSRY